MSQLITFLSVILVFGLVIFIHELGHFSTAKLFKVKVHEFALGMGPCLLKKKKGETQYSLRAIPMGGFVKMEGEDEASQDENAFNNKKPYQRFIILVSGAFMNFILGFILLVLLTGFSGDVIIKSNIIDEVPQNYHSYEAGLREGDKIIKINGITVRTQTDISYAIGNMKEVETVIERNGEKINISFPLTEIDGRYYMGIRTKELSKNPVNVVNYSFFQAISIIKMTYSTFFELFRGTVGVEQMSGPVGIITEIGAATKRGLTDVIFLLILITLNLGVVNLFPLPALDGGRVLFVLYEMIFRRKVNEKIEAFVHFIGFALLILFMIYITKNDIMKLFGWGG